MPRVLYSGVVNGVRRLKPCVGAVALLAVLAACTEAADPAAAPTNSPLGSPSSASSATSTSPTPEPSSVPTPGSMETPRTSSGKLSQASFPRPGELGPTWAYAIDSGDAEEGYVGNGTPALERDPAELAMLTVPFGCPRRAAMPRATHALEVDYTADGITVIAIRMQFADPATARRLFDGRLANLQRCRGRSGGQAIGELVGTVAPIGNGIVLSDRTPNSDPWAELAILDGDQVALLATQTTLDHPMVSRRHARQLAAAFRR